MNEEDYKNTGSYIGQLFSSGWHSSSQSTLSTQISENEFTYITPYIGREMAKSDNVSCTLDTMAESMAQAIRLSRNGTGQTGTALVYKSFVEVQWGWLALPIVLAITTTLLLAMLIYRSQHR